MYVRLEYPKFQFILDTGLPGIGYKVYTLLAGTVDTLQTTYKTREPDGSLSSANDNPIILDERGEATILTDANLNIVVTAPTGDLTSPIISVDYAAEQQERTIVSGDAEAGTTENNYAINITPTFTSIPANLTLVMNPDVDSQATLGTPTFTGSGINDLTFFGPYEGTTAGSIFEVDIESVYVDAPGACTAVLSGTAGSVTVGNHIVKITFVTAEGETTVGAASDTVAADGSHKIDLTNIPVGAAGKAVTARKIYMTKAGGSTYYLVDTIADNTTTTYAINAADAALTVAAPASNTTGDGSGADTIKWRKDSGAYTTAVSITAAEQTMIQGMSFQFAEIIGHYVGDQWTVEVMTPVRVNFCGLSSDLVWKNIGQALELLGAKDFQAGVPVTLVRSDGLSGWILNNPSLPVLSTLKPYRERLEVTAEYTVTANDIGKEISCTGTFALIFPAFATIVNCWGWIRNSGTGIITLTADGTEVMFYNGDTTGVSTLSLHPGQMVMYVTNGVNLHLAGYVQGSFIKKTYLTSGTSHTTDKSARLVFVQLVGGGGGGGGVTAAVSGGGGGGGSGTYAEKLFIVTPNTAYTYAIGAAGAAGTDIGGDGGNGGNTTFTVGATTVTAPGGSGGKGDVAGNEFNLGGAGGAAATNADMYAVGNSGLYGVAETGQISGKGADSWNGGGGASVVGPNPGNPGIGRGSGGSGGANNSTANEAGGAGVAGLIVVTEFT